MVGIILQISGNDQGLYNIDPTTFGTRKVYARINKKTFFAGSISMDEFADACAFLGEQLGKPIPPGTIQDLAHSIDMNKDGFIDLNEFLEAFRIVNGNRNLLEETENFEKIHEIGSSAEKLNVDPEKNSLVENIDAEEECSPKKL